MATAESATAVAATTKAAAIKTTAANAPTDPQTLLGIRGIAPSVYLRPGMCCRRDSDVDGRSGDASSKGPLKGEGGTTGRYLGKVQVPTWTCHVHVAHLTLGRSART